MVVKSKKRNNVLLAASRLLGLVYLVAALVFEATLLVTDFLPKKWLLTLLIGVFIASAVLFIQLFFRNIKRKSRIVAVVISIMLSIVFVVTSVYAAKTASFLNKISKAKSVGNTKIAEKPFTVLISGMDTTGKIDEEARSDVNMLVTVDPQKHKILLTSIPRDYLVKLPSKDNAEDKLTHSGLYGIDETRSAIEKLLDVKIDYYVKVNYNTVVQFINAIGGIYINSDHAFTTYIDHYRINKGTNFLKGEQALAFARERQAFKDGDNQRVKNQQIVLKGIFHRFTQSPEIIAKYTKILDRIAPYMETDMSPAEIRALVKLELKNHKEWKIENNAVEGAGDSTRRVYSSGSTPVYVMTPDKESIKKAHDLIKNFINPPKKSKKSKKTIDGSEEETEYNES